VAKRHRELLARLDPVGLNRYQITEKELETIEKYLRIIQGRLTSASTWQELVQYGGPYGTSIAIHEIVEIRLLKNRGLRPLKQRTHILQRLLAQNIDAHVIATYEEHLYLQEVLQKLFRANFQVATLIKANRNNTTDLQRFLESDLGVYILEENRVEDARQVIRALKGVKKI
jgi:glycine cleavage system pyridoxal-binding protein P